MILDDVKQFAGYRILKSCGRGGFGEVFLAEDLSGRRVALKVFFVEQPGDREIAALRRYMRLPEHPNICRIFHCGQQDGRLFYTMEAADNILGDGAFDGDYLPDTLARRMADGRTLPLPEALEVCQSLINALEVIHAAGMTHRDVKPENVIFVHGTLKLTDFGLLADARRTLSLSGTPGYLPPEFLQGKRIRGTQGDLYAVGKILYGAVTGMDPSEFPKFPSELPPEILRRVCIPLVRLCHKSPHRRCSSCKEAQALLNGARQSTTGWLAGWTVRLALLPRLRRRVLLQVGALLLLTLALGFGGWLGLRKAIRTREARLQAVDAECREFLRVAERIPCQLPNYDFEEIRKNLSAALSQRKSARASENLARERERLRQAAEQHLPRAVEDGIFQERLQAAAVLYGFLESPLGHALTKSRRTEILSMAKSAAERLRLGSNLPQLGESWAPQGWIDGVRWNFVPPGRLANGRTQVDKPFWILRTPLENGLYLSLTKDIRNDRLPKDAPADNLSWNDMMYFCRQATLSLRQNGALLPGYAVRPPTEAEWELAVTGGWSPTENPFGLAGLFSGKKEAVLADAESLSPDLGRDFMLLRGGAPSGGKTVAETAAQREQIYRDTQAVSYSTLRPVIAPTPDGFFEHSWSDGPVWRLAQLPGDDRIWMGQAVSFACTLWQEWQGLLGCLKAHLPRPSSWNEFSEIYDRLCILRHYPTFLDGISREGKWVWRPDGSPVGLSTLPEVLPTPDGSVVVLGGNGNGLASALAPLSYRPAIILEWDNRESFERRRDFWKRGDAFGAAGVLEKVCIGGREYALAKVHCSAYAAESLAELLGTRMAMPENAEELAGLCIALKNRPETILLGGRRRYGKWVGVADGARAEWLPGDIAEDPSRHPMISAQMEGVAIQNGEPMAVTAGTALLMEIPQ